MHYLHMEAPVKVIHRDLKSRNGNVVMFLFYLFYFKTHAPVYRNSIMLPIPFVTCCFD